MGMTTKYYEICSDCGFVANHLTMLKRYGGRSLKPSFDVSTFHTGVCDVCEMTKPVTEPRDFFYPAERALDYVHRYITMGKDEYHEKSD